ncbi:TonB-dependent receptor [uncultured Duncaniella sp.]|uniref:TonB-dependent receptor n=1 Tax=uncultured Duncaniella sp. TaxID=2768039 RepID=UPI0026049676|nr:TonB-dependent receptor [uncultured Duncaniella sp.]
MKNLFIIMAVLLSPLYSHAQNIFKAKIIDGDCGETLVGATAQIKGTSMGAVADGEGIVVITGIPDGEFTIVFSCIGYETEDKKFTFPMANAGNPVVISLEEEENELDEVVVTATRGTRTFKDLPTRVEFIGSEELEEKNLMKPGDIRMLLSESTGIQTQQTSAISGNALIKIQGLDGRYTQILKDGFPAFAGAAAGLGLLQTPPLDLKQVEIIKGSSSTLYGGGAIAGLVNLVSKTPEEKRDLQFQLNGTTAKGLDANGFFGQRFGKVGTTVFASYNRNWAYDPSDVGFTAIPEFDRFTFNPTLFLYPDEKTTASFGIESMVEDRLGGDMHYISHGHTEDHPYFERNRSQRYSTKLFFEHRLDDSRKFNVKNSVTLFKRKIDIPDYRFDGDQWSTFSEVSYLQSHERTEWIFGANVWTEKFSEKKLTSVPARDFSLNTFGAFVQNTTNIGERVVLESGLRGDYVHDYGFAFLPRVSALYRVNEKFSTRIGGGFGYKPPSIFTEESERLQFENVLPIDSKFNKLERSYGGNVDFNYRTAFADGKVIFTVNQLFFYTYLRHPLELKREDNGLYRFYNIAGNMHSKGAETNVKVKYSDFSLFVGYTFTDARVKENGISHKKTLTPQHRVNSMLMYEIEDSWRVGYELYYVGKQHLTDGLMGKDYVTMGFMIQKIWEHISVYANFENFTDRRQTRFDTIYTGSVTNPEFRDIYAPLDGFVANAGIILKF